MNIVWWLYGNYKLVLYCTLCVTLFYSGWHLRSLQEAALREKDIVSKIESAKEHEDIINNESEQYERTLEKINQDSYTLNQNLEDTHVNNSYRCLIPSDGLLILTRNATSR